MATFIAGPALQATSAYNPIFWYATSSETARDQFRYTLIVEEYDPATNTHTLLADMKILPRYGDSLMEVNINKILQSSLGFATDEFDLNDLFTMWLPAQQAGYEYRLTLGEEYLYTWNFAAWNANINGNLQITASGSAPSYVVGDTINVTGIREEFTYTSITNNGGFTQFNFTGSHTFANGDDVSVRQDSPVSFLAYSYPSIVTSFAANSITVNIPYAGVPYQAQTGKAYRNYRADGFHQIVTIDTTTNPGFVTIELDFTNYNGVFGFATGVTSYSDNRTILIASTDVSGGAVFNGAIQHDQWPTYPFNELYAVSPFPVYRQAWLTGIPGPYQLCMRPENEMFLNLFTRGNSDFVTLQLKTYDQNEQLSGTYYYENDLANYTDYTTIAYRMGRAFNEIPVQVIHNGQFMDASQWTITNVLGGVADISSGSLNYLDTAGGNGSSYVVQAGSLVPGQEYVVTLDASNNNFAQVLVGDENNTYQILNDQNGSFSYTFTATGTDFWIEINSAGGVTQGVEIDNVKAKTIFVDALNCDDKAAVISLTREDFITVSSNGDFATSDDWTITNYLGGTATIGSGVLSYTDTAGGNGTSDVVQAGILTVGELYTVSIGSNNNNFAQVMVGDENNTYQILNDQNGTFTTTFTATGTDFWITINSAGGVTQGVDLTNLTVNVLRDYYITEDQVIKICCDCDGRYENVEVLFAERMGSIIPWNFNLNHARSIDISRDEYKHNIGSLRTDPLSGWSPGQNYKYSTAEHSNTNLHIGISQEWDINTDWMNEANSLYFEQLVTSQRVWAKINNLWRAVVVKDRTHNIIMKNNEKMIKYTITIVFSSNDNVQEG